MAHEITQLEDYPTVIQLPILWGYMDAFQHVNNVIYFRFFESARIAYGECLKIHQIMQQTGIGPILAATSCRYLKPLRYPDTIHVGCKTLFLAPEYFDQEYAVYSQKAGSITAVGTGRIVAYDYHKLRKSRFPDTIIRNIMKLEKTLEVDPALSDLLKTD